MRKAIKNLETKTFESLNDLTKGAIEMDRIATPPNIFGQSSIDPKVVGPKNGSGIRRKPENRWLVVPWEEALGVSRQKSARREIAPVSDKTLRRSFAGVRKPPPLNQVMNGLRLNELGFSRLRRDQCLDLHPPGNLSDEPSPTRGATRSDLIRKRSSGTMPLSRVQLKG